MLGALVLVFAPVVLAQVRVLYQNDLSLDSNATSALFISEPVTGQSIAQACSAYNERPLDTVTPDLRNQLDYLVFRGSLQNSSQIYIGGGSAQLRFKRQAACTVFNVGFGLESTNDCSELLVSLSYRIKLRPD